MLKGLQLAAIIASNVFYLSFRAKARARAGFHITAIAWVPSCHASCMGRWEAAVKIANRFVVRQC